MDKLVCRLTHSARTYFIHTFAGVDTAALLAAETHSLPISGFVPLRYTNETGEYGIPKRFWSVLRETSTTASAERTELNIRDAEGILTLFKGENDRSHISKGTQLGIDYARELGKEDQQLCFVDLASPNLGTEIDRVAQWIKTRDVKKCAIGGPRESEAPGIEKEAFDFLEQLFADLKRDTRT